MGHAARGWHLFAVGATRCTLEPSRVRWLEQLRAVGVSAVDSWSQASDLPPPSSRHHLEGHSHRVA